MGVISTPQGFTYHDRHSASFEQAAADVWRRRTPTPGQAFARKIHGGQHDTQLLKNRARRMVLHLYARYPGHLKLFTLPGLKWAFEKDLLNHRHWNRPTTIVAAESDSAIYRAALAWMPHNKRGLEAVAHDNPVWRSEHINWFEQGRIEAVIGRTTQRFTGAWLDLTGPLTDSVVGAIRSLWPRLTDSLVVTFLGARYGDTVAELYTKAGSDWAAYFQRLLNIPTSRVTMHRYVEGVPMVQVTAMKPSCVKRLANKQPLPATNDYWPVQGVLTDWPLPPVRMQKGQS